MIERLTIFGVGLIGGSLALALKQAGFCKEITGCSRSAEHLQQAVDLGVIDRYELDPATAVEGADVIFLSVPLRAMQHILQQIQPHIKADAIITDGGSAKGSVKQAAEAAFGGSMPENFILGHPIAGREKSGVTAAVADLYRDRKVILTPTGNTNPQALALISKMWEVTGAQVELLGVAEHDHILASTSHLPHILAYQLVATLAKSDVCEDIFHYAAGGFQDFTRIASSDPVMWRDICLENTDAILAVLNDFQAQLDELKQDLARRDGEAIQKIFSDAKAARDRFADR